MSTFGSFPGVGLGTKSTTTLESALKIVSEYDQEKTQSQTADKTMALREEEPHSNHETPGRQLRQSNQLSLPHQDDCKTKMDIK